MPSKDNSLFVLVLVAVVSTRVFWLDFCCIIELGFIFYFFIFVPFFLLAARCVGKSNNLSLCCVYSRERERGRG